MGNSNRKGPDKSTERYSAQQCTCTMKASKPARKIVLLGKTGDGKSSSGNTILTEQIFTTESSPESLTAECKSGVATVGGRTVRVIDTPGIFDTHLSEKVVNYEIIKSFTECAPAVDAFVIVLKVGKYTRQEVEILDKISEYCGEAIFKHAVVLFTHGEDLEGQTIEAFVKKSSKLQELVDKCGGRCHVIDNKHWNDCRLGYRNNRVHVKNMLETIDKMVQKKGCFTSELLSRVEEDIQDEMNGMDTILLTPEKKREAAKKIVHNKYLIRLAGVATGTLVGALLGICVAVGSVVALLKAAKAINTTVKAVSTLAGGATGAVVAEAGVAVGIAAGVIFGTAALAGAIGGGITGYKAAGEADSVRDAMKMAAEANCENAKEVVRKAEQIPSKVYKKLQ